MHWVKTALVSTEELNLSHLRIKVTQTGKSLDQIRVYKNTELTIKSSEKKGRKKAL